VGCFDSKRIVLGGDSAVSDCIGRVWRTATPKVAKRGGYLVGACGDSVGYGALMSISWPREASLGYLESGGLLRDLAVAAEKFRPLVELHSPGDDAPPFFDGLALIGAIIDGEPQLWSLEALGCIDRMPADYAIGSGGEAAQGQLYGAKGSPRARALRALEAAADIRTDVRSPFHTVELCVGG